MADWLRQEGLNVMFRSVAILLWALSALAPAQDVTGSIKGTVADSTGSLIARATVRLVSETTGAVRTAPADAEGNFAFTAVTPGFYSVSAEQPGFKKYQKQGIELTPGATIDVGSLRLEVGAVSESVTVRAEGSMVQLGTSERSGMITSQEITDLTMINRDFSQFAELQPGVVANQGADVQTTSAGTTLNVMGGRTTSNNISIDGVPSLNSNAQNVNSSISLDAVQTIEVKLANFQAEYGRNSGATIIAVGKSGAQNYHGAAYFYDRNEGFNANSFFNNRSGLPKQKYRIMTAGGNIGGPLPLPGLITRNKLFFFFSSEEIREVRPQPIATVTVPTAAERQGDFSQSRVSGARPTVRDPDTQTPLAGNIVPASRINKSMQNYLNLFPLPNFSNTAVSNGNYNYTLVESLNVPKHLLNGRVDYNINDKTTMYARGNYWAERQSGNNINGGNTTWGWLPQDYPSQTSSFVLSVTRIFNPTTVLQANVNYQRLTKQETALTQADLDRLDRTRAGVNIPQFNPSINPYNLVPAATFSGIPNAASPKYGARFPRGQAENTFTWNGTLNKVAGPHALKAGIYAERWRDFIGLNAANFAGTMALGTDANNPLNTGYGYSNALMGVLTTYTESSTRPAWYDFKTNVDWYVQDTWKVSRRLTLDVGLRFGWAQPWHSNIGQEAGFVPSLWNPQKMVKLIQPVLANGQRLGKDPITGAILPAVTIGAVEPGATDPFNGSIDRRTNPSYPLGMHKSGGMKTAPRVGFSWDPFGRGRTVIRGGGGYFYNMHTTSDFQVNTELNPPIQTNPSIYYTTVQALPNSQGYLFPSATTGFDPDYKIARTMNYSFGVQQQIGFGSMLDVAYVGALSRHLQYKVNVNATPLGTNFQPRNFDPTFASNNAVPPTALPSGFLRPYRGYTDINYMSYNGNSSYHSLQTTLRRRYKNNLTYGAVWTWSKTMGSSQGAIAWDNPLVSGLLGPQWSYGKLDYDRTHILRVYWTYKMPKVTRIVPGKFVGAALNDWQVSGIYRAQSGAPLGVSYSFSPTKDITGSTDTVFQRVILTANPVLPKSERAFNRAFNTAAIAAPPWQACQTPNTPSICWGNAAMEFFRGPGLNNWDISLFKDFRLYHERLRAQFRFEGYNVFNHTQFTSVNTSAVFNPNTLAQTNTAFGQYTGAASPRRLQLALRISF
jgi:hypothetical protein